MFFLDKVISRSSSNFWLAQKGTAGYESIGIGCHAMKASISGLLLQRFHQPPPTWVLVKSKAGTGFWKTDKTRRTLFA
jgi:hypothetical protein